MRTAALCLVVVTTGCGFIGRTFGSDPPQPDARPLPGDSAVDVQLIQTHTEAISGQSWSCSETGTGYTYENTFYRVFDLAAAGVVRPLHVARVRYGIQTATAGASAGHQPITVSLGTYAGEPASGSLDESSITVLDSKQVDIDDGVNQTINTVFDTVIDPGAQLVAQIAIADGHDAHQTILIASNTDGETGHTYWKAPHVGCDVASPVWMDDFAAQHPPLNKSDIILEVYGTF